MSVARGSCTAVHFPLTLSQRAMEFVGQQSPSGACGLLGVPGLSILDLDVDDDEEVVIGIRPKSSPLPRRRSSTSDLDSESEPPPCGSRRVSFADVKGLSLVQVKEFDTWDVPKLPGYVLSESEGKNGEEYFLSPLTFSLPLSAEDLFPKVREQKIELETVELLPGTTILKGVIRVLNISFSKAVYVRITLDTWLSHFDLLAEYIPGSSDGIMDCFSFKLTLVPPFEEKGARVDFCLRYETPVGTFWANNNNKNYVLFCHQRVKEKQEKPQKENVKKKSCLKSISQNFSSVENSSAVEAASQENISTDVSKHGEKADTIKTNQISNDQSGTSKEDQQKLLTENRRNSGRRNRRKAARMARMRDRFAQRDRGENDTERDESSPEAKPAAREETLEEKHSDVKALSEGNSELEGSQLVTAPLETCNEIIPANDYMTKNEPEKSESIDSADSATLTGGESTTAILDNLLQFNDDTLSAECQNTNKSFSKDEESSQKKSLSYECPGNTAAEPANAVISGVGNKSLVSKTNSFIFGTVMAPLYHQVSGRVGSESHSASDRGNPAEASLSAGDLSQNHSHTERRETSCTVQTDARGNNDKVQGNVINSEESRQECVRMSPNNHSNEEKDTSLSLTSNDIMDHPEALQDPVLSSDQQCTNSSEVPENASEDTVLHAHTVNILNTDLLNPQISTESLHLQGETQEDNPSNDLQSQTTAETAQAQLSEHTCTQIKPNLDETGQPSETEKVMTSLENSPMSLLPDALLLNQQTSYSGSDDCKRVPQTEEINNVEEENKEAIMIKCHIHGNTFVELKDTLKCEEIINSQKIEHNERGASSSEQEDFCDVNTAEFKNWEMMVEEEEKNIITGEEEKAVNSVEEGIEAAEEDQGEQLGDARIETASENLDTIEAETKNTDDEMIVEITDAEEKENKTKYADVVEDGHVIREEQTGETVVEKETQEVEKELEYVHATKPEKTAQREERAEETEEREEKGATLEREKHSAEIQDVKVSIKNIQEEEKEDWEGEMKIDLNDDNEDINWKNQVKPREENTGEENLDYKEEIPDDKIEESEILDAQSEIMKGGDGENEVGGFAEKLDITQNKSNVQDKRVTDKENTEEGQNAQIPAEMYLHKEEDFQSKDNLTKDSSKAERAESESTAAEGGSCVFTDEPDADQLSVDSASAESDSDDEVELYMHCLRAVHAGAQAHKDRNKDTGFSVGQRPSVSRSKLLSTPMPSISESLDEETNLSCLQDNHEDVETAEFQPVAAALPVSSEQESINRPASWWRETFSCSNISKTLLYASLFVVFVVVAYHYDFLACFGLYLVSVIWLCCQGDRQSVKNNRVG